MRRAVSIRLQLLIVLGACDGFPDRSSDLACDVDADCDDGRRCDRGYCVVGPPVDCENPLPCAGSIIAVVCGGACWTSCAEEVTGTAAYDRCQAWNGRLAPLRTADDAACFTMVRPPGADVWTGLVQDAAASRPDVRWSWNGDSRPLDFTAWDELDIEPDDRDLQEDGDEQCALSNPDELWSDQACTEEHAFACRR